MLRVSLSLMLALMIGFAAQAKEQVVKKPEAKKPAVAKPVQKPAPLTAADRAKREEAQKKAMFERLRKMPPAARTAFLAKRRAAELQGRVMRAEGELKRVQGAVVRAEKM